MAWSDLDFAISNLQVTQNGRFVSQKDTVWTHQNQHEEQLQPQPNQPQYFPGGQCYFCVALQSGSDCPAQHPVWCLFWRQSVHRKNALLLLDFSLSQAVIVMNQNCIGFCVCWTHLLVISAAFVNYDWLQHVEPGLKGLTVTEISGLTGELVTECQFISGVCVSLGYLREVPLSRTLDLSDHSLERQVQRNVCFYFH